MDNVTDLINCSYESTSKIRKIEEPEDDELSDAATNMLGLEENKTIYF